MNNPQRKSEDGLDALFAAVRAHRADTSAAEYGFETRLMARLREQKGSGVVWALVSWRFVPFFGACLVALTLWYSQVVNETNDAEQTAYVQNPDVLDSWSSLNQL
jgi:hypothetical protein